MHILQLTAFYLPSLGGIQCYVCNLSRALKERGHRIEILAVNTEDAAAHEERPEGTVHRCALDLRYHRGVISREIVGRLLSYQGYDLVHVHIPFPLGLEVAALAASLKGTPLVVTHHGTGTSGDWLYWLIASSYDRIYRHISLRQAACTVFLTESYRAEVHLPRSVRSRTRIVRTGADTRMFAPSVSGAAVRSRYGFAQDDVVVLWVGSLSEHNRYKGVEYLIEAVTRHASGRPRLLIVGGGLLQDELRRQVDARGAREQIRFAGAIENALLPTYYAAADIFALPSIHGPENSPVVVYEAMAAGRPVVASDIAGVREIVEHGSTGVLVQPRDVDRLARILGLLAVDPELRGFLGRRARSRALTHSWHRCAEQMERIYEDAVTARRGANAPIHSAFTGTLASSTVRA